jgi:hypothetical protein
MPIYIGRFVTLYCIGAVHKIVGNGLEFGINDIRHGFVLSKQNDA